MADAKLLFICVLFLACCCTATFGQMAVDCCLSAKNKTIHEFFVVDSHLQVQGQGCHIDAMILVTKKGKKLCVPPNEPWVEKVVAYVNDLKKMCKKNRRDKRCTRVKLA